MSCGGGAGAFVVAVGVGVVVAVGVDVVAGVVAVGVETDDDGSVLFEEPPSAWRRPEADRGPKPQDSSEVS